jgi:hypothetical protein
MPIIECLIKRAGDGNTPLTIEKYDYLFKSRPEITDGDEEAKVCIVNSTDHCDRLIGTGMYRPWVKKDKAAPKAPPEEKKRPVVKKHKAPSKGKAAAKTPKAETPEEKPAKLDLASLEI